MRKHHCDPLCRNIKILCETLSHTRHVKFMQKFSQNIFWTRLFLMQPFTPNTNFTGKICRILFVKMHASTQHTG